VTNIVMLSTVIPALADVGLSLDVKAKVTVERVILYMF